MTRPLIPLTMVDAWSGLEAFYQAFEARGYAAHRCYMDPVRASAAGPAWQNNLMTYWEELAKETLSSGWLWQFRGEHRKSKGFYRSPFLDEIEASVKPNTTWGETPCAIHPLVAAYDAACHAALKGGTSPEAPKYFDP